MYIAVLIRHQVRIGPVVDDIAPHSQTHLSAVLISFTIYWDKLSQHPLERVEVCLEFNKCFFLVWAEGSHRSYHTKKLSLACQDVFIRLIPRSAPLADCWSLIQIAVVFRMRKESYQFICTRIGIDHVWSVRLQKSHYRGSRHLRFQLFKGIWNLSSNSRPNQLIIYM